MPSSFFATTACPARTSCSRRCAAWTASAEVVRRGFEDKPGIPERARGTKGRGGGGVGLGRRNLDVFDVVGLMELLDAVVDEDEGRSLGVVSVMLGLMFLLLLLPRLGSEAQAIASSISSSSLSQETLMHRPTSRTVVSSGREKWLCVASTRRKRVLRSCVRL